MCRLLLLMWLLSSLFLAVCQENHGEITPLCVHREAQYPVLFVSRLDGIISAIELSETLPLLWEYDLGYHLLSTSNTLSLQNDTTLLPSMDGNLYTLNRTEQSIQPYSRIETLLNKKPNTDDRSRWVGGKVITTIGIGPHDGKVYYTCNMEDCKRYNDSTVGSDPILAVTTERKTVRLLDMKLGVESWNWSISTVDIQYMGVTHRSSCLPPSLNVDLNFEVSSGLISALFQDGTFAEITLSNSLSQSWVLNDEFLHSYNMYYTDNRDPDKVGLYVGMWNNMPYVQPFLPHKSLFGVNRQVNEFMFQLGRHFPGRRGMSTSISWGYKNPADSAAPVTTTAISLIPAEMTGRVWYPIYNNLPKNMIQDVMMEVYMDTKPPLTFWDILDFLIVNSVLEKLLSTILAAGLIGFFVYRKMMKFRPRTSSTSTSTELTEGVDSSQSAIFSPGANGGASFVFDNVTLFESRFEQDFVVIKELGQGGFGKVLEAQHKISEHNYAIKVIKLQKGNDMKKVEREVAAMAKLEHPNILRYYTSWKETPSIQWNRARNYTSNDESIDSGTATSSKNCNFSPRSRLHNTNSSSCNVFTDNNNLTFSDSISLRNSEQSDSIIFRASTDHSDSIVFRKSPSYEDFYRTNQLSVDEDDSLIVFEDSCSNLKNKNSKKPNLLLPLHRKVSCDSSTPHSSSDESQSVRIPISDSRTRSVTFNSWTNDSSTASLSHKSRDVRETRDDSRSCDTSGRSRDSSLASPRVSFLYIQMQLCREKTLKEWLIDSTSDRSEVMSIFSQIIDAVEYIHSKNHIHRDIKPSNILFTEDWRVKVADFGLATVMSSATTSGSNATPEYEGPSLTRNLGTRLYMSPELEWDRFYDYKVDIYALGIVFFEMLMVFNTAMERVIAITELRNNATIPLTINIKYPEYKDILLRMIATEPTERPTAKEIKSYFWDRNPLSL